MRIGHWLRPCRLVAPVKVRHSESASNSYCETTMKYHCCSAILVAAILAATATTSLPRRSRRPCLAAPAAQPAQASRAPHEHRQPSPRRPMIPVIKRFPVTIQAVSLVFNRETLSYRQNAVGWTGLDCDCHARDPTRPNSRPAASRSKPLSQALSTCIRAAVTSGYMD
jgi:hypothetical protein